MAREPRLVGTSQREVQAPIPSVRPEAFGAGIGQALGRTADVLRTSTLLGDDKATADARLAKAQQDRELARTRSDAHVRLIRLRAEFGREQVELMRGSDPSLPDFTNNTQARAAKLSREFLSGLPQDLREEFSPLLQTFQQSSVTTAFGTEIAAQDNAFLTDFVELTELGVSEILATSGDVDIVAEQTLGELERVLETSPLSETAKETQRRSVEAAVRGAQFSKLAREEALGNINIPTGVELTPNANGVYKSDRPVAGGLPAAAVGLLNAIAGPESSGEYNRLYSGDGARYFDPATGGWKHPNSGATITSGPNKGQKSTAAGRYQFINGTWKIVAQNYGLEDFSPENQDKGAWNWAQDYYAEQTNGQNLEAVLRSGDPAMIERVRQVLAEQWEGLKNVAPSTFLAQVTNGTGNPSALLNDPLFENIPHTERMAMLAGAGAEADKLRREMQATYDAQTEQMRQQLEFGLADGTLTPLHIENFIRQRGGTVDDRKDLMGVWEENNAREAATMATLEMARDPTTLWDNDTATQDQLDLTYEKLKVAEEMSKGNSEFFEALVLPLVGASQIIPDGLKNTLQRNLYLQDIGAAAGNWEALAMLAAEAPTAFMTGFSKDIQEQAAMFNALRGTMPDKDLIESLRGSTNPAVRAIRDANRKAADAIITENIADWTPAGLAREIGLGKHAALDAASGAAFQAEVVQQFKRQYTLTGNENAAWAGVKEITLRRWGNAQINGQNRVMRSAPAQVHPAFEGGHDYVQEQFAAEVGVESSFFISDEVSEAELAAGQPVSYRVLAYDGNGFERFVQRRELQDFDDFVQREGKGAIASGNNYLRFTPKITNEMQMSLIERTREEASDYADKLALEAELFELDSEDPDNAKRIRELQNAIKPERTPITDTIRAGTGIIGDVISNTTDGMLTPPEQAFDVPGFPRALELQKLVGEGVVFDLKHLADPDLDATAKRRAFERVIEAIDANPQTSLLRQLRTDFNIFAREQF